MLLRSSFQKLTHLKPSTQDSPRPPKTVSQNVPKFPKTDPVYTNKIETCASQRVATSCSKASKGKRVMRSYLLLTKKRKFIRKNIAGGFENYPTSVKPCDPIAKVKGLEYRHCQRQLRILGKFEMLEPVMEMVGGGA
jgi:hypothetical protein